MYYRRLIDFGKLPRFRLGTFPVAGMYRVFHCGWFWVEVRTRRRSKHSL